METFISRQQPILDEIIAQAAKTYYQSNQFKPNFYFDVMESCREQWLLSDKEKKDLCYDRPSIGFTYSLWYHGKRVNTFLSYFITQLTKRAESDIAIFDLGAGAGAVQWAIGLVYAAMKESNLSTPKISLINIDSSPFMLEYNKQFLWPLFLRHYPCCKDISVDYQINSWTNPGKVQKRNIWIVASYLFDNSESKTQVGADFQELINQFEPNKVLLTTSYNKRHYLSGVANGLSETHIIEPQAQNVEIFNGPLTQVNKFRKELNKLIVEANKIPPQRSPFNNDAKWDMDSLAGIILTKRQQDLGFLHESLSLFNAPFDRPKIDLNEKQKAASVNKMRPTKIIGPAGCGKSVVITERIRNLIEESGYEPSLRILLTTFNKGLIKNLGDWLYEILDQNKIKRTFVGQNESWFCFQGNPRPSLILYHFDILPTRIGKLKGDVRIGIDPLSGEEIHASIMRSALEQFRQNEDFLEIEHFATPSFLLEEYHRILYGYSVKSETEYQSLKRSGRGVPILQRDSKKRELIYKIIEKYLDILANKQYDSFTTKRSKFSKMLELQALHEDEKFTHIFVDELQDCTYADYQIFYRLLKEGCYKHVVIAGDLGQSIHLGASFYIPKAEDNKMGNWDNHFLEGSYRLPFRISEGIYDLSKQINKRVGKREGLEVSVISPYRGAPPGARIIFVFADSEPKMAEKIKCIYDDYIAFFEGADQPILTVYEKHADLVKTLQQIGIKAEDEHILKSKGLEKQFVFWSTRTKINRENEVYQFVYTILTRTCSLLVVGLSNRTDPVYHKIINTFRRDRIILWDEATSDHFNDFCQLVEVEVIPEES